MVVRSAMIIGMQGLCATGRRHKDLTIIQAVRATIRFAIATSRLDAGCSRPYRDTGRLAAGCYQVQAVWVQRNSRMTQPKPITTNRAIINLSLLGFLARSDRLIIHKSDRS